MMRKWLWPLRFEFGRIDAGSVSWIDALLPYQKQIVDMVMAGTYLRVDYPPYVSKSRFVSFRKIELRWWMWRGMATLHNAKRP